MTNIETLNRIFGEVFNINEDAEINSLQKENTANWDSVHQLALTSSIEDEFDIMLDAEDIINLTSYDNAKSILTKYNIEI